MMVTALNLVAHARALTGTPWRHRGRGSDGVDCIGLVLLAAKNAGVDLFALCGINDRAYGRHPQPELFQLVHEHCVRIDAVEVGCLLLFKLPKDKYARHFGLYTEVGTIIHADCRTRKAVVEHGYRAHFVSWTHSAWRLPGIEYAP